MYGQTTAYNGGYYTTTTTSSTNVVFFNGRYIQYYTKPEPEPEPCTEDELVDFIKGKRGEESA